MKTVIAFAAALALIGTTARAQESADAKDAERYRFAQEAVQDLGRILAPTGIQHTYKTKIGGIDQWLSVRGQDRANPIILFVHGGPASPLMPPTWQFQRPIEEYFTVVNWDQRVAGKTSGETEPASISDTIHIPRHVDDAIEVAEHIRASTGNAS